MATETFGIPLEAAEVYEAKFVPALFGEWAPDLVEAADIRAGQSVLDVACGTGVVARAAAVRVGASGRVVGLDLNDAMLTVARRLRPELEWKRGDASSLPFSDGEFDAVLCQAALMFFPDPELSLREMGRVATDGGVVAVQVWGTLESSPGYARFAEVVARHAGREAVELFGAYWAMGDLGRLRALFAAADLEVMETNSRLGAARFSSVDDFVSTETESTPLLERIDEDVYRRIREDAREALQPFVTATGEVAAPIQGHVVTARKAR